MAAKAVKIKVYNKVTGIEREFTPTMWEMLKEQSGDWTEVKAKVPSEAAKKAAEAEEAKKEAAEKAKASEAAKKADKE